jgi:hypothetical protein
MMILSHGKERYFTSLYLKRLQCYFITLDGMKYSLAQERKASSSIHGSFDEL